jgi:hypothetical protein
VCELLMPITFFLVEGRKDPAKVGMMYLCTFILLKLSGERNFGVQLNKTFEVVVFDNGVFVREYKCGYFSAGNYAG